VVTYDEDFIEEWLDSPQTSLYYSLQVMGDVQDKSSAYAALDEGLKLTITWSLFLMTLLLIVIAANEPLSKTIKS
jgi:hypothetical protein